jgi:hypothetical protein
MEHCEQWHQHEQHNARSYALRERPCPAGDFRSATRADMQAHDLQMRPGSGCLLRF